MKQKPVRRMTVINYNHEDDRWYIHLDQNAYSLHCGECFFLSLEEQLIPCRLEYNGEKWYIIAGGKSFVLNVTETYAVAV